MWVGIGVGIGRNRFATGIFNAYALRVTADGGITEAGQCVDAVSGLLLNASLLLIPSGYKGGKLYAEIPTNGNGDLTWTRGSDAFRTNASGLIQRVPWNLLQQSETFDNAIWSKSGSSVTANNTTAPNGTLTADKLVENTANTDHRISGTFTAVIGTAYTTSIYLKSSERTSVQLYSNIQGGVKSVIINLSNGTFSSSTLPNAPTITNVGDGWYRVSYLQTADITSPISVYVVLLNASNQPTYTGDGTSGVYIWGAQLVEGTTAQTYLPTTDRLNFPRLDYTYGSCPAVLLEPQRTNLVLQSETFDNASWVKIATSVTANSTTSPDGTTNADSLIENSSTGVHYVGQQLTKASSSITYAFSVYYKNASGTRNIGVALTNGTSSGRVAIFTSSGTITATDVAIGTGIGFSMTSSSVTNVGNGWYRATVIVSTDTATRVDTVVYITGSTTNVLAYTGDGTSGYFIYGAQLEAGAYPTTYITTTSATATRVADSFSRNNIYTNGLITASGGTWFVELVNNIPYTRDNSSANLFLNSDITAFVGNGFYIRNTGGGNTRLTIAVYVSGSATASYTTTTNTTKIAIKWNGTTADVFVNGTKQLSAISFTATALEHLTSAPQVAMFIQQIALYTEPLTDTKLIELTTI